MGQTFEIARKPENPIAQLNDPIGIGNGKRPPVPIGTYEGIFRKEIKYKENGREKVRHEYYVLARVKHEKHMRVAEQKLIKNLHLENLTSTLLLIPLDLAKVCTNGTQRLGKRTNRKGAR